jgi:hypothetical protein
LDPSGTVLLVLGRINTGAEADWLFNKPADVAFAKNGDIYVADGYGNSRVVKFDRDGKYLKSWGKYGTAIGEFNLPHTVAVDEAGRVYVGDRENQRIQIFDSEGSFRVASVSLRSGKNPQPGWISPVLHGRAQGTGESTAAHGCDGLLKIPGQPRLWRFRHGGSVLLEGHQVIERIDPVEFAGVDDIKCA